MPVLNLQTNISAAKIPEDFERQLCEKVGEVLNKPLEVSKYSIVNHYNYKNCKVQIIYNIYWK